jgi:glutaminase
VGTSGNVCAVRDADYEFTIMSMSKSFVLASMRLRAKPMRGEEKQ